MRKKKDRAPGAITVARGACESSPFAAESFVPLSTRSVRLYYALREAVPVIDAAICKLVRLTGGFSVKCTDPASQKALDDFCRTVPVGGNQTGLEAFISTFFAQLLTCGTAVGEIVTDIDGVPAALWNAPLDNLELRRASDGLGVEIFVNTASGLCRVSRPELCLLGVLDPEPGRMEGKSLLSGLPFVSGVLMKIYESIGKNFERVGNIRYAVTYRPGNDSGERAFAKERAAEIASEWGDAMRPGGPVKDFVAVGDVNIKVIGADNQLIETSVPARQMLEQIVSKTGLPPFMLGLSWSATERMSSQQADALTSELEAYRRTLTPVIERICSTFLRLKGLGGRAEVIWDDITMQDEVELSKARLNRAKAKQIEGGKSNG